VVVLSLSRALRSLSGRQRADDRSAPTWPLPADPSNPADRAVAAHAALEACFGIERRPGLFRETARRAGGSVAFLWPFSRAAAATLDLVELGVVPGERADRILADGLDCYLRASAEHPAYDSAVRPPLGPGGDRFYDDNAWIGLDLVRLHLVTGHPGALGRAHRVFRFLAAGWDSDPSRPLPGGVTWVESSANGDRNTVSTAPAAQLGYQLCDLGADADADADPEVREWADRMLAWVHVAMRDPADGLYWDHVGADGRIEPTKWSYNQGNVIGAELAHHRLEASVRPDFLAVGSAPLARAEAVAVAALDRYDARLDGWSGQGLAFNAVFVRNLVDLAGETNDWSLAQRCRAAATAWANTAWAERAAPDGTVRPIPGERDPTLIDQAALVEAQALAANAIGARPTSA
jgi:hypothetical protein